LKKFAAFIFDAPESELAAPSASAGPIVIFTRYRVKVLFLELKEKADYATFGLLSFAAFHRSQSLYHGLSISLTGYGFMLTLLHPASCIAPPPICSR
jgi:hypothetical protein